MASGGQKKSGNTRKMGRNKPTCERYRAMGKREKNKAARAQRRAATKRASDPNPGRVTIVTNTSIVEVDNDKLRRDEWNRLRVRMGFRPRPGYVKAKNHARIAA